MMMRDQTVNWLSRTIRENTKFNQVRSICYNPTIHHL
jgi:hypothetical protein